MKRHIHLLLALSLFGLPVSYAVAQDQAPAAEQTAPAVTPPAADPNRQICKSQHVIGTNMPQRICMTAAEWEAQYRETTSSRRRSGK